MFFCLSGAPQYSVPSSDNVHFHDEMFVPSFVPFVPEIVPFRDVGHTYSVTLSGVLSTFEKAFFHQRLCHHRLLSNDP
jgi:hypothetical protein